MIKIHTFYDATTSKPEYNDQPSKTESDFYEPLNVLVHKIIRGEKVKMSSLDSYEFADVGKVSDYVFDGTSSDAGVDDLTDIDFLYSDNFKQTFTKKGDAKRASDAPSKASAREQSEPLKDESFVEKADA